MALVQLRNEVKGVNITKRMPTPKKMTLEGWFKAARKLIPEIPDPKNSDWIISHEHAEVKWIKYELHNTVQERCYVVIDRTVPSIG